MIENYTKIIEQLKRPYIVLSVEPGLCPRVVAWLSALCGCGTSLYPQGKMSTLP